MIEEQKYSQEKKKNVKSKLHILLIMSLFAVLLLPLTASKTHAAAGNLSVTYHLGSEGQFNDSLLRKLKYPYSISNDRRTLKVYNLGPFYRLNIDTGYMYGTVNLKNGFSTSGDVTNANSILFVWTTDSENKHPFLFDLYDAFQRQDLDLYAYWVSDLDKDGYPDPFENRFTVQADDNTTLLSEPKVKDSTATKVVTNQAGKSYTVISDWIALIDFIQPDTGLQITWDKDFVFFYEMGAIYYQSYYNGWQTVVKRLFESLETKTKTVGDIISLPDAVSTNGEPFSGWSDGTTDGMSAETVHTKQADGLQTITAKTDAPISSLSLNTDGVYTLLCSGISSQDLSVTLKDGNGQEITDANELAKVTYTLENTDGFEKLGDYDVVTMDGAKATAKKSGVVKIYAHYGNLVSSNYAVMVVPGDINKDGKITTKDAILEVSMLRGARQASDTGNYGEYLANMNTKEGVDVGDVTKIMAMVRKTSSYCN